MPRWMWIAPLGLLTLFLAFHGYKLSQDRARITETTVIDFYAERYLDDHARELGGAAALTDCVGVPGQANVWIEVRCSPASGAPDFIYGADRRGRMLYAGRAGEEPQT